MTKTSWQRANERQALPGPPSGAGGQTSSGHGPRRGCAHSVASPEMPRIPLGAIIRSNSERPSVDSLSGLTFCRYLGHVGAGLSQADSGTVRRGLSRCGWCRTGAEWLGLSWRARCAKTPLPLAGGRVCRREDAETLADGAVVLGATDKEADGFIVVSRAKHVVDECDPEVQLGDQGDNTLRHHSEAAGPPTCVQRVGGDLPHNIDDFCHPAYPIVVGVSLFV